MSKKSQLTVFIIAALVIIIVSAMLLFSSNKSKTTDISSSVQTNIKEIEPVKAYVDETLQDLVIEGMFLIGKQGGKIYISTWPDCKQENPDYEESDRMCSQKGDIPYGYPPYLSSSPYSYKRIAVGINDSREGAWTQASRTKDYFPLQQPFAYLHQEGEFLLPEQEKYNASINYLYGWDEPLPPIKKEPVDDHSIEDQLSDWVDNHLFEMLDFTYFEKTGYDIEIVGEPSSIVRINENDVTAVVNYTILVNKSGVSYELDEFYAKIPYDFRRFYRFIMDVIQEDIISLEPIWDMEMKDDSGNIISMTQVLESNPQSFKYDVINITDTSLDFHTIYSTQENYFSFYFVRENRAPDAGTVFARPMYAVFEKVPQTWYCFNYETTGGGSYLDPDEDDKFHIDPFPFEPKWYRWKSRGDQLILTPKPTCSSVPACPIVSVLKYHNDPDNSQYGLSFTGPLNACGNEKDSVGPFIGTADDVGDILILKVGDQMEYEGGGAVAPLWYVDSPINENGFGRLNDATSYRPIKCQAGETCSGGYWRFNQRSEHELIAPEEYCIETCVEKHFNPASGSVAAGNYKPSSCDVVNCHCSKKVKVYYHVDHAGQLKAYPDMATEPIPGVDCDSISNYGSDATTTCEHEDYTPIGCTYGSVPPEPEEPPIDGPFRPVCCANEDGVCQDIDILSGDSGCGREFDRYTLLSEEKFCNQLDECMPGCCSIRGKDIPAIKQKYECIATCLESNVCDCTSDDLSSCTGDYEWREGVC